MTSIGTLLAFVIVCIGVMVMRKTNPGRRARTGHRSCRWSLYSGYWSAWP